MRHNGIVEVVQGDITRVAADAIVNAANTDLAAGGGVCGAIFRAAGPAALAEACAPLAPCETGGAVITPAFDISTARHIIHAVGPIYTRYDSEGARRLLRGTYAAALRLARENECRSIAFPAISTGIYGYPLEPACREAADVCSQDTERSGLHIKLVAFDAATAACLRAALDAAKNNNT